MGTGTSRPAGGRNTAAGGTQPGSGGGGGGGAGGTDDILIYHPNGAIDWDTVDRWLEEYYANLPEPTQPLEEEVDDDSDPTPDTNEPPPADGEGETPAEATPTEPPAQPLVERLPSLKITGVDLKENSNSFLHHTDEYEQDNTERDLIVRRGEAFKLSVKLNRAFRPKREKIFLQFAAKAKVPKPTNGTLISLEVNGTYEDDQWSAKMDSSDADSITVDVKSAPNAIIGSYTLTVKVKSNTSSVESVFSHKNKIIVLFNAWCEQDTVFMADDAERNEYVLEDSGVIWRGNSFSNHGKRWNFGQFDLDVRKVVFDLLETKIRATQRRSPITISRTLSHIINDRVLEGNWSGNYEGGVRPSHWSGSVEILEKFAETKAIVKYGQCWVFSGLFTTFLRCLGVPARSVTNFDSAHDTEDNMTIDDYFVDGEGKDKGSDSIWNFHVWNEAWMSRPDLEAGMGGWQAVDATPQERSDGIYQCGPAPVVAVKRGMVNQGYDSRFVFAEVNGDRIRWKITPSLVNPRDWAASTYTVMSIDKDAAGHVISTKKVGSRLRNDVTLEYKYKEGSAEERASVKNAVSKGSNRGIYAVEGAPDDVAFKVLNLEDHGFIGEDFKVEVEATNLSENPRSVFLKVKIDSCYYTGVTLGTIKTDKSNVVIGPKESVVTTINVAADEYVDLIDDEGLLTIFVSGSVKETGKTIARQDGIRLKKTDIEVTAEVDGSEVKLSIDFKNPMARTLTDCEFTVQAPKLVKAFTRKIADIPPNEKVKGSDAVISFKARSTGKKHVIVEFDSRQLKDIEGGVDIEIKSV